MSVHCFTFVSWWRDERRDAGTFRRVQDDKTGSEERVSEEEQVSEEEEQVLEEEEQVSEEEWVSEEGLQRHVSHEEGTLGR